MLKSYPLLMIVLVSVAGLVSLSRAEDVKSFVGTWRTSMPKSVTNKPYDMELTVQFDDKGKGFPRFVTPEGGVTFFAGAVTADLYQKDGKDRVVLLREWDVALSKDKKAMTWTEVKGKTKLEFKKQ